VEPESYCTCCGAWHVRSWYSGEEGTFCSERCYQAWFGRLDDYLKAARSGRHYFEQSDYRLLNDPALRNPIWGNPWERKQQ
jgi:hypothetical protein